MKLFKSLAVLAVPLVFLVAATDKELTCPISKKAAKEDIFLNVNGQKVHFCCNNCPKAYAKKIGLTAKLDAEPTAACPISGRPASAEHRVIRKTARLLNFCCGNCLKKTVKKNHFAIKDDGPKKCPVSGKPARAAEGTSLVVNGEACASR